MLIKNPHSTLVFSLSVLLGAISAFTATPAHAATQAEVKQDKTASQEPPEASPASEDVVRVHIEIREWQLSPEELGAIKTQTSRDWVALATRDDAQTRLMHVFDSVIKVGEIGKKGKRRGGRARFSSGVKVPYVTNPKSTNSGQTGASVSYKNVGCTVDLFCKWGDEEKKNEIEASFDIRISDVIAETNVALADNVLPPTFLTIEQECATVAALGEQQVFLRLMNQRVGKEEKVFAYVFSFRFDKPEEK